MLIAPLLSGGWTRTIRGCIDLRIHLRLGTNREQRADKRAPPVVLASFDEMVTTVKTAGFRAQSRRVFRSESSAYDGVHNIHNVHEAIGNPYQARNKTFVSGMDL